MSSSYKFSVDTPAVWGIVTYRGTGFVGEKGYKLFRAKLRADNDPMHYTEVEVLFWSKNARGRLREACGGDRTFTTQELIDFLHDEGKKAGLEA